MKICPKCQQEVKIVSASDDTNDPVYKATCGCGINMYGPTPETAEKVLIGFITGKLND